MDSESLAYSYLQDDLPEELQEELDRYVRSEVERRFDSSFGFSDRIPIFGHIDYSRDNIHEIADKRAVTDIFSDERLSFDAQNLLEEYNERSDREINTDRLMRDELMYINSEHGEDERLRSGMANLGGGFMIGYDNGRKVQVYGDEIDMEDLREISQITDEEIPFNQVQRATGVAKPHRFEPPSDHETTLNISNSLNFGFLRAGEGYSRLDADRFADELPEVVDVIR